MGSGHWPQPLAVVVVVVVVEQLVAVVVSVLALGPVVMQFVVGVVVGLDCKFLLPRL